MAEPSSRAWYEEYTFPAVQNGWLRRARVFLQMPEGVGGLHMNLQAPIFQNKDFRKAMQHLFNFDRLNRNLLYGEGIPKVSFFEGTEYRNPNLTPYEFNPAKAEEYLARAGYYRPDNLHGGNLLQNVGNVVRGLMFTRSDTDSILVNDQGQRASFTVTYGRKAYEPHLTIIQQDFRRAGIDMRLQLLEPGAAFERALERKYEMTLTLWGAGIYPSPRQYLHTENRDGINNNDIWGFGTEEVDRYIETFEKDLSFENRLNAIHRIDEIVQDEAFYIPFWSTPFIRLVHWDYLQFPEFYLPKRAQNHIEYMVYWIDPEKKAALETAMRDNIPYEVDKNLDKDFYGIREQLQ
jgi:microcin C transport system substrate-binding protein